MNQRLHSSRLDGQQQGTHITEWASLPDGTFAVINDEPALVMADQVIPWERTGHRSPIVRPGRERPPCS